MKVKLKKLFCLLLILSVIFLSGCGLAFVLPGWSANLVYFEKYTVSKEKSEISNWLNSYVQYEKKDEITRYGYVGKGKQELFISISQEFDINNLEIEVGYGVCSKD